MANAGRVITSDGRDGRGCDCPDCRARPSSCGLSGCACQSPGAGRRNAHQAGLARCCIGELLRRGGVQGPCQGHAGHAARYLGALAREERRQADRAVAARIHLAHVVADGATCGTQLAQGDPPFRAVLCRAQFMRRDPTLGLKARVPQSDGFHTWSEDEIARYEAHYPVGSKARLALALGLYTAQRRGDVVKIGRQHIRDGVLTLRQRQDRCSRCHPGAARATGDHRRHLDRGPTDAAHDQEGQALRAERFQRAVSQVV